jgi:L,D-transpeptidase ErfK/SrfK
MEYYTAYQKRSATHGYAITINRAARTLTLFKNGAAIRTYPVAVGKPATPTPLGNFSIIEKRMNPGGAFGARWMRFAGGNGIHGTNNPSSIGKAISHGCVRMHNRDVIEVYSKVDYGTPVRVIGNSTRSRILGLGVAPGSDIVYLQHMLLLSGYYAGPLHGVFDVETAWSVASFQQEQNIVVDGIVGPETRAAMQYYRG